MKKKQDKFDPKLLDALLEGHGPQTLFANDGLVAQLKEALANRMLSAEMAQHLDTEADPDNYRNGYGRKAVSTDQEKLELLIPRDRKAQFEPQLVEKHCRRL